MNTESGEPVVDPSSKPGSLPREARTCSVCGTKFYATADSFHEDSTSVPGNLCALGSYQAPPALLFDIHVRVAAFCRERRFAELPTHFGTPSDYRCRLINTHPDIGRLDLSELKLA